MKEGRIYLNPGTSNYRSFRIIAPMYFAGPNDDCSNNFGYLFNSYARPCLPIDKIVIIAKSVFSCGIWLIQKLIGEDQADAPVLPDEAF